MYLKHRFNITLDQTTEKKGFIVQRKISKLTFNYEIKGEGKPIIILHGNGPDHRMMVGCMEPVFNGNEKWKRVYLDLPGMGLTVAEDWIKSSDDMLKAVEIMIEELIPGESFLLVGESYGAYLARGLLKNYRAQIDGLFLLCPCVVADSSKRTLPSHQVIIPDDQLLLELDNCEREEFQSISVVQTRNNWMRYKKEIMCGLELANEQFLSDIRRNAYEFSFEVESLQYTGPTLILSGRQDSFVGYKDAWNILDRFPRATFAVLDCAGHNLQIEQEAIFHVMVREWLSRTRTSFISIAK